MTAGGGQKDTSTATPGVVIKIEEEEVSSVLGDFYAAAADETIVHQDSESAKEMQGRPRRAVYFLKIRGTKVLIVGNPSSSRWGRLRW